MSLTGSGTRHTVGPGHAGWPRSSRFAMMKKRGDDSVGRADEPPPRIDHLALRCPSSEGLNVVQRPTCLFVMFLGPLGILIAPGNDAQARQSLGDLTGPWQLLVDDYLIADKNGTARTYHSLEKYPGNPVLLPTEAWEDSVAYIYGTVLPDETGTGYRMWYHTLRPEDPDNDGSNILYATSPDGITWTKPNLGIRSWHGSTANNMIFVRPGQSGITSVIHTPWNSDPNRQYTLMNFDVGGYWGAYSPDGIHTFDLSNNPVITDGGDVGQFMWDPFVRQFRGYVKLNSYVNGLKRRSVGLTTTASIESWPPLALILEPDAFDDRWVPAGTVQRTHLYGMSVFAYETMYLGFLWIFRATDAEGYYIGPVYAELVSSRDGVHWKREEQDRPPILPLGTPGQWDDGQLYTAVAPVLNGDTLMVYYGACDNVHGYATKLLNCAIGLATLRKDGFVSIDAGPTGGTMSTRSLLGASGPLHVNYRASGGWLKVEVLDADDQVVPGYDETECVPLQGDSVDQIVTWQSHSELPADVRPLRLRFIMRNASLYSFMAGPDVQPLDSPAITRQPYDQTIAPGGNACFVVEATGTSPLVYQWRKNGRDLVDGGRYGGTNAPTLTITTADLSDAAVYDCLVSNPYGSIVSAKARLNVTTAEFIGLGTAPGATSSVVTGIATDGSVICGNSGGRPFIWTAGGGIRDLGLPTDATSAGAAGVGVYNGNILVAINSNASNYKAKRWEGNTAGQGAFTNLPLADTLEWTASGLGTNGDSELWISGSTINGGDGNGRQACRYRLSTGTVDLPVLPNNGHDHSDFHAVSDNGCFAGQYQYMGTAPTGGARNPMKFTGASPCQPLNTLFGTPTTKNEAVARAVSRNGSVQGGWSYYINGVFLYMPCVWINSTTPTAVGFIPGGDSDNHGEILALSGDGALAGGYSLYRNSPNPDGPREALIWDAAGGARQLQGWLSGQYGLNLAGWTLQEVRGISADGQILTGNGNHNGVSEGWMLRFTAHDPPPPTITQQPLSQVVCPGDTAMFQLAATGQGPLSFWWIKDGRALSDDGHYAGTDSPTLTISGITAADAGSYRCRITAGFNSIESDPANLAIWPTVPADLDGDCDVDQDDVIIFEACAAGPGIPYPDACPLMPDTQGRVAADFDGDGDVDQADFGAIQRCLTGHGTPADSHCRQ